MKNARIGGLVTAIILLATVGMGSLSYFGVGRRHTYGYEHIKQGLDLSGGVSIVYEAVVDGNPTDSEMSSVVSLLQARLDRRGWTEAEISRQGNKRVRVEIPGVEDIDTAVSELGRTAHLTFRDEDDNVLVDGVEVANAYAGVVQKENGTSQFVVHLEFTPTGTAQFSEGTGNNVGKRISVCLDDDVVSSPTVNQKIDNAGYIEGDFTQASAEELAALIRSGSLPFNLDIMSTSNVGAKLGANSLETSVKAGFIGICLVLLFMICVYRAAGVIADIALLLYTGIVLVLLSALGMTLTLPGIAGIVLSIGMAVDANVIIFERLKEELRTGKTMRTSVKTAFQRAFSAILDGNVTTLISAGVLYWLGTGPIKGFAQTLSLGIVVSMFTALFITRLLLMSLVSFGIAKPTWFGLGLKGVESNGERVIPEDKSLPIVQNRVKYFIFSGAILLIGVVMMVVNGSSGKGAFNLDVEFSGGLSMTLDLGQDFVNADVQNIIKETTGQSSPQVQRVGGTNQVNIKILLIEDDVYNTMVEQLTEKYPQMTQVSKERVSATVSGEMQRTAIFAVLVACAAMFLYITIRFRDFALGGACIIAIVHDAFIMLAAYVLLRIPLNYSFIAAILTVLGYSINASIVVFDRLRENRKLRPGDDMLSLMNISIRQTLTRSIYTTLTTLFTIVCVAVLGVPSVREFSIPIIIGLVFGTYSSICLAGSVWFMLSKRRRAANNNAQ